MPTLRFQGEVLDVERYLDGTREFMVEAAAGDGWQLTLSFRWPKDAATVEEGDLTLTAPDGAALFAACRAGEAVSGWDDGADAERTEVALWFAITSGEDRFAATTGDISVRGTLSEAGVELEAALPPAAAVS